MIKKVSLPKLVEPERISVVNRVVHGLKKVATGRTDVFLAPESIVVQLLTGDGFKDAGIRQVGVIQEVPLFAFLLPAHKALAIDLAEVLKKMKSESLIGRYRRMAEEAMAKGE